ncbi:MAG: phage virion morphogenesis protein [Gammaproteobacteria bacterium]|nr:phage virion morphogenesis protein [Gammaproteobacteria bacterium]
MTGTAITIDDQKVKERLADFLAKTGDLRPAMTIIGQISRTSIVENFEEGGRPDKWEALADSTLLRKKSKSILVESGFKGGLLGSIHEEVSDDSVLIGTNKVYAAIHHWGGETGRNKKTKIKARPYMMWQDEDYEEIIESLTDYLME